MIRIRVSEIWDFWFLGFLMRQRQRLLLGFKFERRNSVRDEWVYVSRLNGVEFTNVFFFLLRF